MSRKKLEKIHVISYDQKVRGKVETKFIAFISSYAAKTKYGALLMQKEEGLNNIVSVIAPMTIPVEQ